MKTTPPLWLVLVFAGASVARAVEIGASREAVEAELGAPQGEVASGALAILYYPRGEVRFERDRVVEVALMSEAALAEARARDTAEAERRALAARLRSERLEAEGRAIRDARLVDPAFTGLPASERLRLWRAFALRYPTIPVRDEILVAAQADALLEAEARAEAARRSEFAALEARVEAAEARAARAEREARNARGGSSWFFSPVYSRPHRVIVTPPREECPPEARPHDAGGGDLRARVAAEYDGARAEAYRRAWPR